MFIYFTSIIFTIIKSITHNCNISSFNQRFYSNETVDYNIACESQKVQRINASNIQQDSFLSIYDYSNVIITCPNKSQNYINLFLSIYGEPTISFENYCHINKVEIHGSPRFQLFDNSFFFVNTLILYNQTYSFPFEYNNIFYFINTSKSLNSNMESTSIQSLNNLNFQCDKKPFNVSLCDNHIIVQCNIGW